MSKKSIFSFEFLAFIINSTYIKQDQIIAYQFGFSWLKRTAGRLAFYGDQTGFFWKDFLSKK